MRIRRFFAKQGGLQSVAFCSEAFILQEPVEPDGGLSDTAIVQDAAAPEPLQCQNVTEPSPSCQ